MRGAFFYGPNTIRIENKKFENFESESILLEVLSCSVCSYDVRTFRIGSFKVKTPVILGHEICARTVNNDSATKFGLKPNTRVAVYPIVPCLECWYCKSKKFNLCTNLKEIGSTINGGFADYIQVPVRIFQIGGVLPIPELITNGEASLIEPLSCCINGINQVKSLDFEDVSIIGDGPIALMQLMLLKKEFPDKYITIIGKIPHRLNTAKKIGADQVINLGNDDMSYDSLFCDLLKRPQPNLVFVSNNNVQSIDIAFKLVNKNGKLVIFSGLKIGNDNQMKIEKRNIDLNYIHYNQISIYGSFSSTPENFKEAIKIVNNREINLSYLITNAFKLEEVEDALEYAESLRGLKAVINMR